jgi:hypothetical protein
MSALKRWKSLSVKAAAWCEGVWVSGLGGWCMETFPEYAESIFTKVDGM